MRFSLSEQTPAFSLVQSQEWNLFEKKNQTTNVYEGYFDVLYIYVNPIYE
jgi:hypothetical protein